MDDNTAQNNQNDPASALSDILAGSLAGIEKDSKAIIQSNKFSNEFLKNLRSGLQNKGITESQILDLLLSLDESVEKGELTQDNLKKYIEELNS